MGRVSKSVKLLTDCQYCVANNWSLDEVVQISIDGLQVRYPDGFEID